MSQRVLDREKKNYQIILAEAVADIYENDEEDTPAKRQVRYQAALQLPVETLKEILLGAERDQAEDAQLEQARNRLLKSSKDSNSSSSSSRSMSTGATTGDKSSSSSSSSSSSGTGTLLPLPENEQSIKLAQEKEEERIRFQLLSQLKNISAFEFEEYKKPRTPLRYLKELYFEEHKTVFVPTPPTPPPVEEAEVVVQEEGEVIQVESSSSSSAKSDTGESVNPAEKKRPTPLVTTAGTSKGASSSSSLDPQPALKKLKTGEQLGKAKDETSSTKARIKKIVLSAGDNDDDEEEDDDVDDDVESDQDVLVVNNNKTKAKSGSSSSSYGLGLAAGDDSYKSAKSAIFDKSAKSGNKKSGGTPNPKKKSKDTSTSILFYNRHQTFANRLDELAETHKLTSASKMNDVDNEDRGYCEICVREKPKSKCSRQCYLCRGCTRVYEDYICWICLDHSMEHAFAEAKQAHFHMTAMEVQAEEEE